MKSIQEVMNTSVNEAKNYPYTIAFSIEGKIFNAKVTLESEKYAALFDKWIESEIGNNIYHADGGPNDIEL